jgi:hypothetical protein
VLVLIVVAAKAIWSLEAYLFAFCGLGLALAAIVPSPKPSGRYLVAPSILLVSALVLLKVPPRVARGAVACALVLVVLSFPVAATRRSGHEWNGRACDGRTVAVVPLAPRNWGTAVLTCSALH